MERLKLKAARVARRLSQPELANIIGYSREAISQWERGGATPGDKAIVALCTFFDKDPAELDLANDLTESELAMLQEILKNKKANRRQALAIVTLPAFTGVDFSTLSKPLVSPEQFLSQSGAAIKACWQLMKGDDISEVESLLPEFIPTLEALTTQSKYQDEAASLLTQAKLMQIRLATRNRNFASRKVLCLEAVQFGELSGDPFLHMAALFWHGDTYVYCYHRPQKAIDIFKEERKHLNGDSWLSKSKFSLNLAIAYAQKGDESKAMEMADQARKTVPQYPRQDPAYPYINMIEGNLEKHMGRIYLALAKYPPGYAQKACDVFEEGIAKCSHQGELSQTLIHHADASIYIGDLDKYIKSLGDGMGIAIQINNEDLKSEARKVRDKAPDAWKKEKKYQKLAKMF